MLEPRVFSSHKARSRLVGRMALFAVVLLPSALLALLFVFTPRSFHSDDVLYWMITLQWRELFQRNTFASALNSVVNWPNVRPTFQPFLGVPVVSIFGGSIDLATECLGIIFSLLMSFSLFSIFRRFRISEVGAALCCVTVASLPLLLGQGRFYMAEFPFAAFSLSALAALLSSRYWLFAVFCGLAFLERPLEGILVLPGLAALAFCVFPESGQLSKRRAAMGGALAMLLAAFAFWGRRHAFIPWISVAAISGGGLGIWRVLRILPSALAFVPVTLFRLFGVSGLLLVCSASVMALRRAKSHTRMALGHFFVLAMLAGVLFLIACFDNGVTIDAVWRYSLTFMLLALVSSLLVLGLFAGKRMLLAMVGVCFVANLFVIGEYLSGNSILDDAWLMGAVQYQRKVMADCRFQIGMDSIVDDLKKMLPDPKGKIVFVGRSQALYNIWAGITLRCKERLGADCFFTASREEYFSQALERDIQGIKIDMADYGVGAMVFASDALPEDAAAKPYPSSAVYQLFLQHEEHRLGLVKFGEIPTHFEKGPKLLQVFRPGPG